MSSREVLDGEYRRIDTPEDADPVEANEHQADLFEQELVVHNEALVYKRNEIIHAHYSLTPLAHKCLAAAISCLDPHGKELRPVHFSCTELARATGVTRQGVYAMADSLTTELKDLSLKLPYLDKDWEELVQAEKRAAQQDGRKPRFIPKPAPEDGQSFKKISIFREALYNSEANLITFIFEPRIADYLIDLRGNYTYYQHRIIRDMAGAFSIRLYEILRSALSLKDVEAGRLTATKVVEYAELRKMMGLAPGSYKRFSDFEKGVLRRLKPILASGDLTFDYELPDRTPDRPRAKVKTILFKVRARGAVPVEDMVAQDWRIVFESVFTKTAQAKLLSEYTEDRIKRNILYYRGQVQEGVEIKRPSGWLRKAIKDDYAGVEVLKSGQCPVADDFTLTPDHLAFMQDQLVKLWPTFDDSMRDDFLEHGFMAEHVGLMYQTHLSMKRARAKTQATAKQSNAEKRAKVSAEVMDVQNTDW